MLQRALLYKTLKCYLSNYIATQLLKINRPQWTKILGSKHVYQFFFDTPNSLKLQNAYFHYLVKTSV